jgi:sugar phosphate isomerase/epimerase
MNIYISTGGNKFKTAKESVLEFSKAGINSIELSGGLFSKNLIPDLIKVKDLFKFQIHNYFPPQKIPFVINLASLNKDIESRSLNHVRDSIILAKNIGATHYSFHAGFLLDPKPEKLGKKIDKIEIFDRQLAKEKFFKNVKIISEVAKENNIQILVENNVVSYENLKSFDLNPFLISDPQETKEFLNYFNKTEVNILLDVAHLKVSANSLDFKLEDYFEVCKGRVGGYHLSDNDGLRDSNQPFNKNTWFWSFIDKKVKYYTIEVYNTSANELKKLSNLVEQKVF